MCGFSSVVYTYDALNRLISVTDNQGQTTTFEYDAVGNQTHIRYPNGLTNISTFDSLNRVTAITTLDADDNVITRYAYTLDATGRRASLTEHSGRVSTFTYDDVYRLTNESITDPVNGDNVSTYTYDATGNAHKATYTITLCTGELRLNSIPCNKILHRFNKIHAICILPFTLSLQIPDVALTN